MRCRSRANSRSRGPRPRAARQKAANGGEQPAVEADGAICAELRTGPKLAPRLAQASIGETGVEVNRALEGGGTEITVTKPRAGRRFIDLTAETLDMVATMPSTMPSRTATTSCSRPAAGAGRAFGTGAIAASPVYARRPG
jgi:hypothetical protein